MEYGIEMVSCEMMYVLSFMRIDTDVQTLLKFSLRNLRGFNVGITDEGYL
jgi:hypothetical protein